VTSQTARTKYKWPPYAVEWTPPWKFSAYATGWHRSCFRFCSGEPEVGLLRAQPYHECYLFPRPKQGTVYDTCATRWRSCGRTRSMWKTEGICTVMHGIGGAAIAYHVAHKSEVGNKQLNHSGCRCTPHSATNLFAIDHRSSIKLQIVLFIKTFLPPLNLRKGQGIG